MNAATRILDGDRPARRFSALGLVASMLLVIAGVILPASPASASTIDSLSVTSATQGGIYAATLTATATTNFDGVYVSVTDSVTGTAWQRKSGSTASTTNLPGFVWLDDMGWFGNTFAFSWSVLSPRSMTITFDGFIVPANAGPATVRIDFIDDSNGSGDSFATIPLAVNAPGSTVTFNANGGTGSMAAQTASTATALTSNAFTRAGYDFVGWNTVANGSGTSYANGASYPFTSSTTLYAVWAQQFTVSFDVNGGTGSMSPQVSSSAANLTANSFTRTGYTFGGWATSAGSTTVAYTDGQSYPFTSSTTLYAIWTANVYTVTFDANGGSGIMPSQSSSSAGPLGSNTFTRADFDFLGWATASGSSTIAYADGASFPFTADQTLYAVWAQQFTVTFDANGGSGSMSPQVSSSAAALTSNAFTRTGYAFAGWATSAGSATVAFADGATHSFTANQALFAVWSEVPGSGTGPATVIFNANGGSGVMLQQTAGAPAPLATNAFTRAGYTFAGWNTQPLGTGTSYTDGSDYSFATSVTLYAQWTAVPGGTGTGTGTGSGTGTGTGSGSNSSGTLAVSGSGQRLASTGAEVAALFSIAVGLVGVGLLAAVRRRREESAN